MSKEPKMSNTWWTEFGFTENPYGTGALVEKEGNTLLVGRDNETKQLSQLIVGQGRWTPKIPILKGDNGVGKTSIVNVVAYRLQNENPQYLFLDVKSERLSDRDAFRQDLYGEIAEKLLSKKRFLRDHGVSIVEILMVSLLFHSPWIPEGGVDKVKVKLNQNPRAEKHLMNIVDKWLGKCFGNKESGALICAIDNLEMKGTPREVSDFLDKSRDGVFAIKGLSWVLCGTASVIEPALARRRLEGYLSELEIQPVDENLAPELVQCRIKCFARDNAVAPVDKSLFQFIYVDVTKKHLRTALSICNDFASYLSEIPDRASMDRTKSFKMWLSQIAGRYVIPATIPDESWKLFDYLLNNLNGDCTSEDTWITDYQSSDDLREAAIPLSSCGLVSIEDYGNGFALRTTEKGLLVNYNRNTVN